jgi:hypothetical protein
MKLGIIGTAGRKEDGERLKLGHWILMNSVAETLALALNVKGFVSGGAAWADHVAVSLYLKHESKFNLSLHLPAKLTIRGFMEGFDKYDAGRTSNYYHELFSKQIDINSFEDLNRAAIHGADITVGTDFKSRNTLVANEADILLAFTFGNGSILKDGGTKDTMDKFLKRKEEKEELMRANDLNGKVHGPNPFRAFHYDLNSKRLFEI